MNDYETYLKEQELAEGTISTYMRYARRIEHRMERSGELKKTVLDFKQDLKQENVAPATLNLAIIAVNKYLKFCGLKKCTVKTEKIQKRKSLENVISSDEYRKMLQHAIQSKCTKYYYIMKTLAQTGIRVSELRYFTVEVLEKKKIQVSNKGKIREIYLPDGLIQELYEYCGEHGIRSGVIFKGNTSKPIGRASVYKMLARIGAGAGISKEKVYPHSFRHLFAVTYMNCYGNLTELADILGHSNLETTRIYTLTTAEEKRKRMDSLGL
ncbi:MAG TPA: tyrosine-type recombinase/integrase [Candidatus Mediterraneibacter norfolkensis]|nr:tyrosine-type recombinase/integrase [Candidatus Mediterraneibacter norfolkensis]